MVVANTWQEAQKHNNFSETESSHWNGLRVDVESHHRIYHELPLLKQCFMHIAAPCPSESQGLRRSKAMGKDWCSSWSVLSSTAPSLRSWSPWLGIGWREPVGSSNRTKDDILWFLKEFFFHASLPRHFVSIYFFCRASSLPRCSALSSSDLTNDALKCAESPWLAPCSGLDIPLFFPLPFLPFPFPWTKHQSGNNVQLACSDTLVSLLALPFPGFLLKKFFPVLETVCALNTSSVNVTSNHFCKATYHQVQFAHQ